MRYNVAKCDNPNCGKEFDSSLPSVFIHNGDSEFVYDLCPECFNALVTGIKTGSLFSESKSLSQIRREVIQGKEVPTTNCVTEEKVEDEDIVEEIVEKKPYPSFKNGVENLNKKAKLHQVDDFIEKPKVFRSNSKINKLREFGVENVAKMYLEQGMSAKDICEKIGVPRHIFAEFVKQNNLYKNNKNREFKEPEKEGNQITK